MSLHCWPSNRSRPAVNSTMATGTQSQTLDPMSSAQAPRWKSTWRFRRTLPGRFRRLPPLSPNSRSSHQESGCDASAWTDTPHGPGRWSKEKGEAVHFQKGPSTWGVQDRWYNRRRFPLGTMRPLREKVIPSRSTVVERTSCLCVANPRAWTAWATLPHKSRDKSALVDSTQKLST